MKKSLFCFLCIVLFSCKAGDSQYLKTCVIDNDTIYTCDITEIPESEKTIMLSELIDSFQIVHFENTDTALFKTWKVYITDQHIGILQHGSYPFKLFNHSGTFVCDVGSIGQAHGEYTGLYSGCINEKDSSIWLAPFYGNQLMKYDMNGKCVLSLKTRQMRKPIIRHELDNTLSLANLFFKDVPGFLYLRVLKDNSLCYIDSEKEYAFNAYDKEGSFTGFNNELWFYNNTSLFTYMTTLNYQLFNFDTNTNKTRVRLSVIPPTNREQIIILDELPMFFIINMYGEKRQIILADKKTSETYYVKIQNDFLADLPVYNFSPSNGWYYEMFEPIELIDLINQHLMNNNPDEEKKDRLEKFLSEIEEEGNNILFMGKLKLSIK